MITSIIECYKCEYCRKFYQIKRFAENHEKSCKKNPANDRACFGCKYLNKKDIEYDSSHPELGEEWFDEYWINHGSATMIKDGKPTKITTLKDFLEFKGRKELWDKIVARTYKKKTE